VFASVPIPLGAEGAAGIGRADIEIGGLEHAGSSYELRIFVDNPGAGPDTEPLPANGYAGSIYVYGYGDPLPPALAEGGGRLPLERSLPVTDAVVAAAARGPRMSVTLVVVPPDAGVDLGAVRVSLLLDAPSP
jgi:hypothetical protein